MTDGTEDFAAMFEASTKAHRVTTGETVDGTIVAIGPEVAFVDVGGKAEATVAVGDRIQAIVVSTSGGLQLSRRLARGAATDQQIEDAFRAGLPVEGRVEQEVKGGFEVRVGRQRAFCPFSQIDLHRSEPSTHIGQVYTFRIVECAEAGRNLVVSRRKLLEAEQLANEAEVRQSVVAGAVLTGRVVSVPSFGALVDLGSGVQGLLHVSEMGWSRVAGREQRRRIGDEITVKVLRVDDDGKKIALGLKQLAADPWLSASSRYQIGQQFTGRVTRVAEFGAFVELEPGVEALAHASTFAPAERRDAWSRDVPPGTEATFEILSIDPEKRRIGVALVPEGSRRAAEAVPDDAERGRDEPAFGSLADKLRGALERRK